MKPSEQGFKIIGSLYNQASTFIKDAGEFYPFGVLLEKNVGTVPIAIGSKEEFPNSSELIQYFEDYINSIKEDQNYLGVGIAIDIKYGTSDAIWIRLDHRELDAADYLIEYEKNENGEWIFYNPKPKEEGTLKVWNS